jgi:DNA repair exonuclease SbcCD ATPase subunit
LNGGEAHGFVWFNKRTGAFQRHVCDPQHTSSTSHDPQAPKTLVAAAYRFGEAVVMEATDLEAEIEEQHEEILELQAQIEELQAESRAAKQRVVELESRPASDGSEPVCQGHLSVES